MRLLIKALAAVTALVMSSCDPPARATPVPDRVAMAGDSILVQAFGFGGDLRGADVEDKTNPGWEPRNALPRVQQDVGDPTRSPDVLVVEFGHNMAMDTYGVVEHNELTTLVMAPHESACVVLVLPYAHPELPVTWRANLARVTTDLLALAEVRPNTQVVDWSDVAVEHPEYLVDDHVHLDAWVDNNPAPASVAFMDLIWSGVARCN